MNETPPYIREAVDKTLQAIESGRERVLLSIPIGQTLTVVQIIQAYYPLVKIDKKRILIVTDRREIAEQFKSILVSIYSHYVGIAFLASELNNYNIAIVIAHNFLAETKGFEFDLVVMPNCERVIGKEKGWLSSLASRCKFLIGIDYILKNSIRFFGEPVFQYSMRDAINDQIMVPVKLEFVTGFYDEGIMEKFNFKSNVINEEELDNQIKLQRIWSIAESILNKINNEKTVVFCNSQEEAENVSRILNSITNKSIAFPAISKRSKDIPNIIHQFINEEAPFVLTTVDLLYSGLDIPNIKNVAILRFTSSPAILGQIISRGARRYKGKDYLMVYDYVGVFRQMSVLDEVLAGGGTFSEIQKEKRDEPKPETKPEPEKVDDPNRISKTIITFHDRQNINGVLGVKDIAEELAEVIKILPGERGSMIGIFGKWGRGKTFLMDEVWKRLADDKKVERVDFHAWKYQDTPASWAYLYETLSLKYTSATNKSKQSRWFINILRISKLNFKRNGGYPAFKLLMIMLVSTILWLQLRVLTKDPNFKTSIDLIGGAAVLTFLYKLISDWNSRYGKEATKLFLKYSKKHSFKEHLGLQAEIQKELIALLKAWIPEEQISSQKIIIFVDDIDRCSELKIVQLIDALRVMLEDDEVAKRVVVITAIDERILKLAIRSKYYSILKEGETININMLTKEYFDKLFIIGIKLGDLSSQERDEFFLEFIKNDRKVMDDGGDIAIPYEEMELPDENDHLPQTGKPMQEANSGDTVSDTNVEVDADFTLNREAVSRIDKLYPDEIAMLRSCLKNYDNATPRQIRIFYYRFLMAKNLLIKQYSFLRRKNIWLTDEFRETFVKLIILYSQQEDALLISQHKVAILHAQTPEEKVFLLDDVTVPTPDYGELLKALDIVLAY